MANRETVLTWKKRYVFTITLLAALISAYYVMLIKPTWRASQLFFDQNNALQSAEHLGISNQWNARELAIDKKILSDTILLEEQRARMLDRIVGYADTERVNIVDVSDKGKRDDGRFHALRTSISTTGTYQNLVQFLYRLERLDSIGLIISVNFYSIPDNSSEVQVLTCTILFENVSTVKND